MDKVCYLERIGMGSEIPAPTSGNLGKLQMQHLYTVPYENLDILAGKPIVLEQEALYEKIVLRHRGGYCFELNELFGCLLRELGYEVTDCFGRFLRGESGMPMRRHHVLLVKPQDTQFRYLVDTGVGSGSPTFPMRLVNGEMLQDGRDLYRLRTDETFGWVLEEKKNGAWGSVYCFTEEKQYPIDFVTTSFYCEKSPDSKFNKAAMVSLRTPTGRMTRDGSEFRVFGNAGVETYTPASEAETEKLMQERFGL